ncbi:hypothetical protein FRC17_006388 [Serendipita sp. 399]|nr:hypothetical protein FRC17_006388 [Serendipita sp. 399]
MKVTDAPPPYASLSSQPSASSIEIPPLPPGIPLTRVYSDFLKYLFDYTERFFVNNTPGGRNVWDRLRNKIAIVLATPNGWDTSQQIFMRDAVVAAGIVGKDQADERVDYITEGEASVHYALAHSQSKSWLRKGVIFAVTDAGGSTVDSTLYQCKEDTPKLVLEEVRASECVQAGGVFIDRAARNMLVDKLTGSKYSDEESIDIMVDEFEKKTKRIFDGTQLSSVLHFGRSSDNDRQYSITRGRLSLNKAEVKRIFDPTVLRIIVSCRILLGSYKAQHPLLVGGFGESHYLQSRMKEEFENSGIGVVTVEEPSKKAAAEGAAIWFLKQLVTGRAVRYTLGANVRQGFDPVAHPHHRERGFLAYVCSDGNKRVDGIFDIWVERNQILRGNFQKVFEYSRMYDYLPNDLGAFTMGILVWEGAKKPVWCETILGELVPEARYLCKLTGDLSRLRSSLSKRNGIGGRPYWMINFQVLVSFGGTKLQARMQWYEGTRLQRSAASRQNSLDPTAKKNQTGGKSEALGAAGTRGGTNTTSANLEAGQGKNDGSTTNTSVANNSQNSSTGGGNGGSVAANNNQVNNTAGKGDSQPDPPSNLEQLQSGQANSNKNAAVTGGPSGSAAANRTPAVATDRGVGLQGQAIPLTGAVSVPNDQLQGRGKSGSFAQGTVGDEEQAGAGQASAGQASGGQAIGEQTSGGQTSGEQTSGGQSGGGQTSVPSGQLTDRERRKLADQARKQQEDEMARERARLEEAERQRKIQEDKEYYESRISYYEQENATADNAIRDLLGKNEALRVTNQTLQAQWSHASAELDAQRRTLNATRSFASREGTVDAQALIQLFNDLNASIGDFAFEVLRGLDEKAETRVLDEMDFQSLSTIFKIKPDDPSDLSVDPNITPFFRRLQKMNPNLSLTPMDIIDPIIQYMLCRSLHDAIFTQFAPALALGDSNTLHRIYSQMKQTEPQERRARWRSITYKQALSMQKEGAVRGFIEDHVNKFIAGVFSVLNALNRTEESTPPTNLFKAAGEIFLAAMKVQEKAKTEYVSFDYEVSFYQCEYEEGKEMTEGGVEKTVQHLMCHHFDKDLMEVSQGDKDRPPKTVWMTVGFGMIAWKGVKKEGGGMKEEMSIPVKAKSIDYREHKGLDPFNFKKYAYLLRIRDDYISNHRSKLQKDVPKYSRLERPILAA